MALPVRGDAITMKTVGNLRPELKWAAGLVGIIKSFPRGGAFRVLLTDANSRRRHARVRSTDVA